MTDYITDIQKYTKTVDESVVSGIVKHLGIALQSADASSVACSDSSELNTVRESFLKRKLGLTLSDTELDKAISDICQQMKDSKRKSRVTFYYLLAEKFDKQTLFKK